jgi:type I restriction enzyme S subunit
MQFANVLSNFSIFTSSAMGINHLRNLILMEALSGAFSETKPASWTRSTLGAEVEIVRGITFPSSAKYRDPSEGRIACLRTANVQDQVDWIDLLYVSESYVKNEDQYIRKNDILISMANSRELVGKVSLVKRDDIRCTLGGFIAAIRAGKAILPEFLMILLRAPDTKAKIMDSSTQTTNIANISLGRLRPLEIRLPTIEEQLNIVTNVSRLLDKCDQLEASLGYLQAVSTSARKSAVDAISTAHTPGDLQSAWQRIQNNWNVITGTPESIASLRQLLTDVAIHGQLFGRNEIGSHGYPANWKVSNFKSICDIQGGNQPPKTVFISEPRDGYVQLYQIRDLGKNPIPVYIPISLARSTAVDGEILIGRYGASVGKIFKAKTGAYNVALVKFIFPTEELNSDFIYWFLKSSRSQSLFTGMSRSAQAGFNKRDLGPLLIPIPTWDEQERIVERLNSLMDICDELEKSLNDNLVLAEKFAQAIVATSA